MGRRDEPPPRLCLGRSPTSKETTLNKLAFASALVLLSGAFYLILYLLAVLAPGVFRVIFNAQFLGADVASLLPPTLSYGGFLGTLVTLMVSTWVFGYLWAWLYNTLGQMFRDV